MKKKDSEPTFSGGLKKGHEQFRQMRSTPTGGLTILVVFASMFWLFFLAPATCMKLNEVFPKTGIGSFVGLAMYFSWFLVVFIIGQLLRSRRNIRLFAKPKPSLKEAMPYLKEEVKQGWKEINR